MHNLSFFKKSLYQRFIICRKQKSHNSYIVWTFSSLANNVYYYEICRKELLDGYNYWIPYTTRKSLNKKRRKFIDWQRSDRLWLMDSFTSLLTVVWPNAIPIYTFIQKTPRVWRSRERKKKAPFLKKRPTHTHSQKPHDLSNWAIYLDHHGVKMYKFS